jgi:NAD(P)-dependent dehydrogenase (short-subunit alcohol dehydrogenase family)
VSAAPPLLREGLLEDVGVLLAAAPGAVAEAGTAMLAPAVGATCAALGASVRACPLEDAGEGADEAMDSAVAEALAELGHLDVLCVDGDDLLARADLPQAALATTMQRAWNVTRAFVQGALLARGRPGRIVYLAPAADAGGYAEAARAGLENLARTLSIEWARHGITLVTIAPGGAGDASEVATLVAYLASPAGAYFSGCLLDLRRR